MTNNFDFYEDLFQNCPDMLLVGDAATGKIFDANQTTLDKTGYTLDEIRNMPNYHSLYHPDCSENLAKCRQHYIENGFLKDLQLIVKTKTGAKIPVSVSITGIKDRNGHPSYTRVYLKDITDTLKVIQLEQQNHDLNIFAHLISHDIKSPLSAIYNLASWVEEDCKALLPEKTIKHLHTIKARARRLEVLLEDLNIYFLSEEADKRTQVIKFSDLLEDIKRDVVIPEDFEISTSIGGWIFSCKKILLQQVLFNLITNAIKHHPNPLNGKVRITGKEKDTKYIFSVEDNGAGIPPQYHKYIFEVLKTLKRRDLVDGSGMGLAIVKKIITQEGGHITLRSKPGQGSKFIFTWPKMA